MLLTFGTPYRGSLNAVNFISNGFKKQLGGLDLADLTDLLRSFTSVYQLLPIYPCYDPGGGTLVRIGETAGIPGVNPVRAASALAFHREIERAVEAHLKDDAYLEDRYAIHPIIGTYQPTLQSAKLIANTVEMSTSHPKYPNLDGDGTVPRPSATPLELDKGVGMFVAEIHGSLQNADPVLGQLAGLLSGFPLDPFRQAIEAAEASQSAVSMTVDDAYAAGEPITIRSRYHNDTVQLTAVIANVHTGLEVARQRMHAGANNEQEAEFAPLPEGTYRITVSDHSVDSVSDVFIVSGT
jgi:hypothetical protein